MIKYRTRFDKIEAIEVLRETEHQVVLPPSNPRGRECRESKRTDWSNWHDTWEDARAFLMGNAQREVDRARMALERAKGRLGNIKGMKKPAEEVK